MIRRALLFTVIALFAASTALASKKSEEEWIALLSSTDEGKVTGALQGLEKEYPDSLTARAKIISMLKDPREKVQRKAARVLGAINAKVDAKVLADITPLLRSTNKDAVADGLKALRGLDAASTVPQILPPRPPPFRRPCPSCRAPTRTSSATPAARLPRSRTLLSSRRSNPCRATRTRKCRKTREPRLRS